MARHTYVNLRYAVLHSADWICNGGHIIHLALTTIHYDDVVWC